MKVSWQNSLESSRKRKGTEVQFLRLHYVFEKWFSLVSSKVPVKQGAKRYVLYFKSSLVTQEVIDLFLKLIILHDILDIDLILFAFSVLLSFI